MTACQRVEQALAANELVLPTRLFDLMVVEELVRVDRKMKSECILILCACMSYMDGVCVNRYTVNVCVPISNSHQCDICFSIGNTHE